MTEPKQPQDHLAKAEKPPETDDRFRFTVRGEEYVLPHTAYDVISVGFVRRWRHNDTEFMWRSLELMIGEDEKLLDLLDTMTGKDDGHADWKRLQEGLWLYLGATLGE